MLLTLRGQTVPIRLSMKGVFAALMTLAGLTFFAFLVQTCASIDRGVNQGSESYLMMLHLQKMRGTELTDLRYYRDNLAQFKLHTSEAAFLQELEVADGTAGLTKGLQPKLNRPGHYESPRCSSLPPKQGISCFEIIKQDSGLPLPMGLWQYLVSALGLFLVGLFVGSIAFEFEE